MLFVSGCTQATNEGDDAPMSAGEIVESYGKSIMVAPERARELSEAISEKVDREEGIIEGHEN